MNRTRLIALVALVAIAAGLTYLTSHRSSASLDTTSSATVPQQPAGNQPGTFDMATQPARQLGTQLTPATEPNSIAPAAGDVPAVTPQSATAVMDGRTSAGADQLGSGDE